MMKSVIGMNVYGCGSGGGYCHGGCGMTRLRDDGRLGQGYKRQGVC